VRAALCGERDAPDRWLACSVLAGLTSTNKIMKLTGFAVVEASSAAAAEAAKTSGDLINPRGPPFMIMILGRFITMIIYTWST
jgi:hypothetical protein